MKKFLIGAATGSAITALGFVGNQKGWFGKVAKFAKGIVTKNQKEDNASEEATPAGQTA